MGSLALAACASNNSTPPAASSDSVAQTTNEPNRGPDFAPASNDGLAAAPAERRQSTDSTNTTGQTPSAAPRTGSTTNTQQFATGELVDTTNRNAAGTPADRSSAPSTDRSAANTDADNTRVNQRDRSSAALTPMDQGGSASDRAITQQIRKDLMNDKSLSFTAKNVKVITIDGKVTLRGAVKTEAERTAIEAAARRAAGGDGARVDSQLEISK